MASHSTLQKSQITKVILEKILMLIWTLKTSKMFLLMIILKNLKTLAKLLSLLPSLCSYVG